jgi:hypothetical protein
MRPALAPTATRTRMPTLTSERGPSLRTLHHP